MSGVGLASSGAVAAGTVMAQLVFRIYSGFTFKINNGIETGDSNYDSMKLWHVYFPSQTIQVTFLFIFLFARDMLITQVELHINNQDKISCQVADLHFGCQNNAYRE